MSNSIYTTEHKVLVEMLRNARLNARLSQTALAGRLKIEQTEVSKYERGEKRLDIYEIRQILESCNADFVQFMTVLDFTIRERDGA